MSELFRVAISVTSGLHVTWSGVSIKLQWLPLQGSCPYPLFSLWVNSTGDVMGLNLPKKQLVELLNRGVKAAWIAWVSWDLLKRSRLACFCRSWLAILCGRRSDWYWRTAGLAWQSHRRQVALIRVRFPCACCCSLPPLLLRDEMQTVAGLR